MSPFLFKPVKQGCMHLGCRIELIMLTDYTEQCPTLGRAMVAIVTKSLYSGIGMLDCLK